jgi:extradiol dioxygenase family protein
MRDSEARRHAAIIALNDARVPLSFHPAYIEHMVPSLAPFHLAIPVHDLAAARAFYGGLFGCPEGRSASDWVDFDFFGHQLVAHLERDAKPRRVHHNAVDGQEVPVPHFGIVLSWETWEQLAARLRAAGVRFEIEPGIRFAGLVGEQATMFLYDPSGNALEFKAFRDPTRLFAK